MRTPAEFRVIVREAEKVIGDKFFKYHIGYFKEFGLFIWGVCVRMAEYRMCGREVWGRLVMGPVYISEKCQAAVCRTAWVRGR